MSAAGLLVWFLVILPTLPDSDAHKAGVYMYSMLVFSHVEERNY